MVLFLTISICHAQKEGQALIDSLVADLPMMKEDTNKVKTLALLSFEFRNFELEQGVTYGKEALKLSKELNYRFGEGISELSIAYNYFHISLMPEAIEHAHVAENVFLVLKDQDRLCAAYLLLSTAYGRANKQKSSEYLELAKSIIDKGSILTWQLNNLSWLHNISLSYKSDSSDYYLKLYGELLGHLDNKYFRANYFKMLAGKHEGENNLDSSIYYYRLAIPIYEYLQIKRQLAWVYMKISRPKYWRSSGSGTSNIITEKESETNLNTALSLALEAGNISLIKRANVLLYTLYLNQHRNDKALTTLQQVVIYTDSLQKIENEQEINNLVWNFELRLQEKEIKLLELRSRQQLISIAAGVIVVGTLLVLVFSIIRSRRKIKKAYLRVNQQNEQLDKLLIQLKDLDKMKSRFFTNVSHEFRTPLTLILGPLEKLQTKFTDHDSEQDLNMMKRNTYRLQNLINQLLSLSKIESGKMKLKAREVNIVALINGYLQSFESLARQKEIDLTFNSDEEIIKLFVDIDKIEKILFNLLSNAFKFTPKGGRIIIEVHSPLSAIDGSQSANTTAPLHHCTILITDTGRGIPPDKLPHIFDRFYQTDDSYTKDQEGTGIGLALTQELVNLHHGNISVESEVGKGTTFSVFLPKGIEHFAENEIVDDTLFTSQNEEPHGLIPEVEISGNDIIKRDHQNNMLDNEKEDKPHLLIVDDNTDLRNYMRGYLENDYYISEARDGAEGAGKAIEKIPDLIISDVMMPKMDGYELSIKLKTDERTCHIPLILLTARASKESRLEGLETGADDFITKPFDGEELLVRVRNLIDQRKRLSDHYRKGYEIFKKSIKEDALTMDEKFLQKARKLVEKNISDTEYGVDNFASDMALSRFQLHRKLRALFDQSITEFIRTIRLNYAIGLLKKRAGTISEIAYDAGFNNPTYFSSSFRQQYGISPTEYLEQLDKRANK